LQEQGLTEADHSVLIRCALSRIWYSNWNANEVGAIAKVKIA
jgi:hypothetical protein